MLNSTRSTQGVCRKARVKVTLHSMTDKTARTINILALICAIWFLITGAMWVYLAALFIAYPVGLAGAIMWYKARKTGKFAKLNRATMWVYIIGLLLSLGSILLYQ